jgi:hypothetical protein
MGDNQGKYWEQTTGKEGIGMYGTMNVGLQATVFNQAQMKSGHDLYLIETYG